MDYQTCLRFILVLFNHKEYLTEKHRRGLYGLIFKRLLVIGSGLGEEWLFIAAYLITHGHEITIHCVEL
jgi:hypothetical protein